MPIRSGGATHDAGFDPTGNTMAAENDIVFVSQRRDRHR